MGSLAVGAWVLVILAIAAGIWLFIDYFNRRGD